MKINYFVFSLIFSLSPIFSMANSLLTCPENENQEEEIRVNLGKEILENCTELKDAMDGKNNLEDKNSERTASYSLFVFSNDIYVRRYKHCGINLDSVVITKFSASDLDKMNYVGKKCSDFVKQELFKNKVDPILWENDSTVKGKISKKHEKKKI
jgi:hypothetical protein